MHFRLALSACQDCLKCIESKLYLHPVFWFKMYVYPIILDSRWKTHLVRRELCRSEHKVAHSVPRYCGGSKKI